MPDTVNEPVEVAEPELVVTTIFPVTVEGMRKTSAELEVLDSTSWGLPSIVTDETFVKLLPVTVIIVPGAPLDGLKEVMPGTLVDMSAVPHSAVTLPLRITPLNGMLTLI